MNEIGQKNPSASLKDYGIHNAANVYWNLLAEELVEHTIKKDMGVLSDTGALCISTGKFTGRDPKDRFIVKDDVTKDIVDWNHINQPFDSDKFDVLYDLVTKYFEGKDAYVKDAFACADDNYRFSLRVVTEYPWSNKFVINMFLDPTLEDLQTFEPEWVVLNAPGCLADVELHGTRQPNFALVNFTKKRIIIGGTGYTGEIKKGIFAVLNYLLPTKHKVLSMHCSANVGKEGDTAIFFGLSGTGKTTLSADPDRNLIGDDEHGWSDEGVFNFEGGCYAKCIDLTEENEPDIYRAIKHGAILENIKFFPNTRKPDYTNTEITVNTRVSYPLENIANALEPSIGGHPANVFFLTCDAFGVLPPISRLLPGQAMYQFISGYTAKVAGTEAGVTDPEMVFSACFGAPFLPLHPTVYAELLGEKMRKYHVNAWLINTGWTGGPFGVGSRIKLRYTRAMISAALNGDLDNVAYQTHPVFGLHMPVTCTIVPTDVLNPTNTWADKDAYYEKANFLANAFVDNFKKFESMANEEIMSGAPKVLTEV